jgi:tRNA pseudouridine55 synthase
VVNVVQRHVRPIKVGHAGTLDPLATGVLVIALGPATRLIAYVQQARKCYRGEFLLGRESETEDMEGTVVELPDPPRPTREDIVAVLPRFRGRFEQRPPAYSALKVGGRRAYDLARAGQSVELAARPVEVYALELVEYAYPRMVLDVVCGAGTYIRSLGRDIATAAGTAAVMSALTRTAVGAFALEDACELDSLSPESICDRLRSPLDALAHLPQITLSAADLDRIARGMSISLGAAGAAAEAAALDQQGRLRAILVRRPDGFGPSRNFPP